MGKLDILYRSRFSKANLTIIALIFAAVGGYALFHSFAAGPNIWISTTGNDSTCVRGDSSHPCATPQKACSLAQPGDIIQVNAGTYSVGFNLTSCTSTSTITFENQPGTNVFFAGNSAITDSTNVTLQGDQVGHGVGFSLGFTDVNGSSSNITWNNINLYCQNSIPWIQLHSNLTNEDACSSALTISGNVNGFTWDGGDQSDWATCLTNCTHTGSQGNPNCNQIIGNVTNILIEHVTVKNYFSLDNNGSAGDHSEAWSFTGGAHVEFLDDSWTDCAPPASTGYAVNNSCNTSYLFWGQSGSSNTSNDYTFVQNIIAPGNGEAAVAWDYNVPAGQETAEKWEYNTIDGAFSLCGKTSADPCGPGAGSTMTGSNIIQAGNIGLVPNFGGCWSAPAVESHNVYYNPGVGNTAANCNGTDKHLDATANTAIWNSPGPTSYDYTAKVGSAILNAGENTYCPSTDIYGTARPTSSPCDAGAIQYSSGGGSSIPGDLNSDGHVNIYDLSILISNYGTNHAVADINKDGIVDSTDLSILVANYGT